MSTTETRAVTGEFAWHDLLTTDVEAAKRFYGELLGWEFQQFEGGGPAEYPLITANGAQHGGMVEVADAPPHWIGHVRVTDADEAQRRAEAAGGKAMGGPGELEGVGRWAPIADPGGASISAFSPAYDSPAAGTVFAWLELMTSDPDRAKQFYAETLGWGTGEMEMGEAGTYGLFKRADGQDVAGVIRTPEGTSMPDVWYPYLATADVDGSTAKAKELGATVYVEPMDVPSVGRFSVLADPAGAAFGLFTPVGG
jgi:predicted enzyme related to lactoylglutathione lyase